MEELPDLPHPDAGGDTKWTADLTPIFEEPGLAR